jgi:hypothetical protein
MLKEREKGFSQTSEFKSNLNRFSANLGSSQKEFYLKGIRLKPSVYA